MARRSQPQWTLYRHPDQDTKPRQPRRGKGGDSGLNSRKALMDATRAYRRRIAKASLAAAHAVIDDMVAKQEKEEEDKYKTWKEALNKHLKVRPSTHAHAL